MTVRALAAVLLSTMGTVFPADFALADDCPAGPYILSRRADHWSVLYRGFEVYSFNGVELNDLYGGKPPRTDCGGVFTDGGSYFGMVVGHESDLLVAFGTEGDPFKPTVLRYYPHDGGMTIDAEPRQFIVAYGREHDLRARFCWSKNGDQHWYHNADHRAGAGPCVSTTFPWSYPNSSVVQIK